LQGRRQFLGAAAALVTVAGSAVARSDAFHDVPKHLQVFRTPPGAWPDVVSLCRKLGIGTVAIAIAPDTRRRLLADPPAGRLAFRPFTEAGLVVRCMIGEGSWARDHRRGVLPANLAELLSLHDQLFRFDALLLDVEPQVLPEWKRGERAGLIRGTLGLFADARAACHARGLKLSAALAPWYTRNPDPDRSGMSFLDSCLERLDEALLMAYRNQPDAILDFAAEAIAAVARRPVRCWLGLTTQANNAPGSTYHGLGFDRLRRDVVALHARLQAEPSMAGIAIHQYATLRDLARDAG
jgi:hypothetical protein